MVAKCACLGGSLGLECGRWVRNGYYRRKSDSKRIRRWRCLDCGRTLSEASHSACFGQNKRRLNYLIYVLICSGCSQRRVARVLRINPKTVAKKILILAEQKRAKHERWLRSRQDKPWSHVLFDEMETHEHTKWKPLSLPLVVAKDRKILGFDVCSMPARGRQAAQARRKYGPRADERYATMDRLVGRLKPYVAQDAVFLSDEKPTYPTILRRHYALGETCRHLRFKGRRGCVVGQGELKRGGFDPLFSLNHTAAMIRDNIKRLNRRTWCTTKRRDRLEAILWLYVDFHNHILTA